MEHQEPETFTDVVDRAIEDFRNRKLLANAEVIDVLLDVRLTLSDPHVANPAFAAIVDRAIEEFRERKLLANAEVMDVLLDMRLAITGAEIILELEPAPAPDFSDFAR